MVITMKETDRHKPDYNIKSAAQMSGVTTNLIRAYERMGLIHPYRHPGNNYRLFTLDEVEWIARIKKLINEVGLNIEGIKCVLTIKPCWEERDCPNSIREKCQAYRNYNHPCWHVKTELSCCPADECYKCSHYISSRQHPKLRYPKED